ncbi:pancreatic secretory granule membrane major glycoprotein GP2-like [Rana temporaria]|uniref:pancreatic secretory granule membrane major glycoprotein GP2-like n=1 Tax=Rana temporaria TaxID=8407 RepID=UPI001AACBB9C|nr:pancreatic secretory granule membrane major glycoprotein GP2-like [Rana temporaria]
MRTYSDYHICFNSKFPTPNFRHPNRTYSTIPFSTITITTPRTFSTTTITTPSSFSTTTITTPHPSPITTHNASTQICKADEEWQLRDKGHGCFCKDPYKVTTLSQVVPEKTCGSFEMRAAFHKCQFNDLSIYFNESHVKDNACYDFQDDPVTNTFSVLVPLKVGGCKALAYETNKTHIMYKINIIIDVDTIGNTPEKNTLIVPLQCSHTLDIISSLNTVPDPIIRSITIAVSGKGEFKVHMSLYNGSYTTPYTGSEAVLSSEEILYIGVFFLGDTSNFILVMDKCYATATNDMNDPQKYHFFQSSCPKLKYSILSIDEGGSSNKGRFSVTLFKYVGDSNHAYIHCAVSLCDISSGSSSHCYCRAGSRSVGTRTPQSFDGALTIGPIRRSEQRLSPEDLELVLCLLDITHSLS